MKTIKNESFVAQLDDAKATVSLTGILRLSGATEYADIAEMLAELLTYENRDITINISQLEFLNSSGIAMLSRFMINARKKSDGAIIIIGSSAVPWQSKSLQNLKRLLPALELSFS